MTDNQARAREMNPIEREKVIDRLWQNAPSSVARETEKFIRRLWDTVDAAVEAERERILKIVEERTPPKHTTALAAHTKAVEIAAAIRAERK